MLSEKGCLITTHGHQSKPCCTGVLAIEKIRQFTLKWVWKISLKSRKMKEVYGTPTNGTFLSWYLFGVHIRQKWWLWRIHGGTLVVPLCEDSCHIHFLQDHYKHVACTCTTTKAFTVQSFTHSTLLVSDIYFVTSQPILKATQQCLLMLFYRIPKSQLEKQ